MAIISHRHRIVFFPLPKNCSSSVKHLFYQLETGLRFRKAQERYGLRGNVHAYFPSRGRERWEAMYDDYDSIVIVRDPIRRFLSAYSNRLVHAKALEASKSTASRIAESGLPLRPTVDEFVENLEAYCDASPVMRNHVAPQHAAIGAIFSRIDRVLDISDIPKLEAFLSERCGRTIVLPHRQSGGPKLSVANLGDRSLRKLTEFYREDYEMLADLYRPA